MYHRRTEIGLGPESGIRTVIVVPPSRRAISMVPSRVPETLEAHVRQIFLKLDLQESADDHRRVLAVLAFLRSTA